MALEISWKKRAKTGVSAFHQAGSLNNTFFIQLIFSCKYTSQSAVL
jgi:hypothetical protein